MNVIPEPRGSNVRDAQSPSPGGGPGPAVPPLTVQGASRLILFADDDGDDRMFIRRALSQLHPEIELREVEDGEALMDYLRHRGRFADRASAPRPDLILLDLNMPRKGGYEALREIKSDPSLRQIPVVVLTTSHEAQDIVRSYDHGANAFITKPVMMDALNRAVEIVGAFWFGVASIPRK